MQTKIFSIFLDYQCNFWCSHCSVGSSPKTVFPMPDEILERALTELPTIPDARLAVFTGGEPTLQWDRLLDSIRRLTAAGLETRLVSNGWWARTPAKAEETAQALKEAGLSELSTSFDDFHVPFIEIAHIANLIRASAAVGLQTGLAVVVDKDARWNGETVRDALCAELGLGSRAELEGLVAIVHDNPTPSGSGQSLDLEGVSGAEKLDVGCGQVLRTVSIHPNGLVKACCGHVMFYEPDLTIGNLHEESLPEIVDRSTHNALYWWIHSLGPKRILERIGVEGTYTSQCHACQVMLRDHRDEVVDYLMANREDVLIKDILLSDKIKQSARILLATEEELVGQLRAPRPAVGEETRS